jgi:glycosyltransferase involved in cell wall biosynthesis
LIIGAGEEKKNIQALIKENGMENRIILVGAVDEAREYLKAFDIFLMSSVKEGLPFAILEAGFAEVPVISTSVGAIPEVVQNLETGLLIHPARPLQIKNALIYMEEHPEIERTMARALKKRVAETFNFEAVSKKIKELYMEGK